MSEAPERDDAVVQRDAAGRFLPGGPGGPGRPRGPTQSELVRVLIEPHRQQLIERALAITKSADEFAATGALRILLERLAPAPKQEPEKVVIAGLGQAVTLEDKARAVISAVAEGAISAESGEKVLRMLDVLARAIKLTELEARLASLESGRTITVDPSLPLADGSDLV